MRARMTSAFAASHGKYVERLSGIALGGKEAKTVALLIPSMLANLPDEVRLGRIEIALDDETWLGSKHHELVRQYVFDLINTGRATIPIPVDSAVPIETAEPAGRESSVQVESVPEVIEPKIEPKQDDIFVESEIKRVDLEVLPMKQLRKTAKELGIKINATWSRSIVVDKIMEAVT